MEVKTGDKAYLFKYEPNSAFYLQEISVLGYDKEADAYNVRTLNKAISTSSSYDKGESFKINEYNIKYERYVKNVLKKFGYQLIQQIFERMFKHGS